MHTINVRELQKNPSLALRKAREGPVLILKGNEPDAVLMHLDKSLTETAAGMRPALAASLYNGGGASLGKAAKISGLSLSGFIHRASGQPGHRDRPAGRDHEPRSRRCFGVARVISDAGPLIVLVRVLPITAALQRLKVRHSPSGNARD
jgi:antitoxin (DNA-binding transcriptional repressor) of toxin-antitoxin stability system